MIKKEAAFMPQIDLQPLIELEATIKPLGKTLAWRSCAATHIGKVRSLNEDAFHESSEQGIWAVADGMGGHSRGDYASKSVVFTLSQFVRQGSLPENISDIENRMIETNHRCRNAFRGKRVGTTVALLFEYANHCFFIWAGDSRIYRTRNKKLALLTTDHSLAQEKYARGELSLDEAESHPSANMLTRAVGVHEHLKLELRHGVTMPKDRYLICSDGLYNHLSFEEIESILQQNEIAAIPEKLLESALNRGGKDNITVVAIEALEL